MSATCEFAHCKQNPLGPAESLTLTPAEGGPVPQRSRAYPAVPGSRMATQTKAAQRSRRAERFGQFFKLDLVRCRNSARHTPKTDPHLKELMIHAPRQFTG